MGVAPADDGSGLAPVAFVQIDALDLIGGHVRDVVGPAAEDVVELVCRSPDLQVYLHLPVDCHSFFSSFCDRYSVIKLIRRKYVCFDYVIYIHKYISTSLLFSFLCKEIN